MNWYKQIAWALFLGAIAGVPIAFACTATGGCTTCQNATVSRCSSAVVTPQRQDASCTHWLSSVDGRAPSSDVL